MVSSMGLHPKISERNLSPRNKFNDLMKVNIGSSDVICNCIKTTQGSPPPTSFTTLSIFVLVTREISYVTHET